MKRVCKQLCMALAFIMTMALVVTSVAPMEVEAKTYSVTANTKYKKAPALKVKRMYTVRAKKNYGTTKFTASSTGRYAITISNIHKMGVKKNTRDDSELGNFYINVLQNGHLILKTVKTNGGKVSCIKTATPYSYSRFYKNKKVEKDTYLAKRTAKLTIKKGTTLYFQYYFTGAKCTYNLQIKKI